MKFTAAYGTWLLQQKGAKKARVLIGRDARISGEMIRQLVAATLQALGIDVLDLGLSTTPTVEVAVAMEQADGGIILTASHNPKQWNALKLLNEKGEFISAADGQAILDIAASEFFHFAEVDALGSFSKDDTYIQKHIEAVLNLPLVNVEAIRKAGFKVVVDAVNSTGGLAVPALLKALGVEQVTELYCEPNGHFPHNPEPLAEHLTVISSKVVEQKADLGIVVDPDVDRLALVCEDGTMFGEEYTLVACADYVLSCQGGNTVSNLSSSRALRDITEKHGGSYEAAAVGEVNVVHKMKEKQAVIGGEGNGGVIYPELHYGRDALVGIALFLSHLALEQKTCKALRETYPSYHMSKDKIALTPELDVDHILAQVEEKYRDMPHSTIDGVKVDFDQKWFHLRKSNTEPIIRIYTESTSHEDAQALAREVKEEITNIAQL